MKTAYYVACGINVVVFLIHPNPWSLLGIGCFALSIALYEDKP